jgi:SAM-dependent methyltransferase
VSTSAPRDHRAAVGPADWYDLNGALQFSLLVMLGLREDDRMVDIGCGSLRAGRFLITYLAPERYYGIEPDAHLVAAGIERELGADAVALKHPTFAHRDDFGVGAFEQTFDFALAQSILSHTHEVETRRLLEQVGANLAPRGVFAATFFRRGVLAHRHRASGMGSSGWTGVGGVQYSWAEMRQMLHEAGLAGILLDYPHTRQTWFVAVPRAEARRLRTLRRATKSWRPMRRKLRGGDPVHQTYAQGGVDRVVGRWRRYVRARS